MLEAFAKIAEQKIREAQERGDFDNLPGKGKPLELEDDSNVPEDVRIAYKILKNAGYVPQELEIRNQIVQIEDMLRGIKDEEEKYRQIKKLNFLVMKLNMMRKIPVDLEESQRYYSKMVDRVTVAEKKEFDKGVT